MGTASTWLVLSPWRPRGSPDDSGNLTIDRTGASWPGARYCYQAVTDALDDDGDGIPSDCDSFSSCQAHLEFDPEATSGIYEIDPDTDGPIAPFDVYCDMESHDGGWPLVLAAGSGVDITGETGLTDIELRGDTLPCPDSDAEPPVAVLYKISEDNINAIRAASGGEIAYWVTHDVAALTRAQSYSPTPTWDAGGHWWDGSGSYRWAFGHANEENHATGEVCYDDGTGLGPHSPPHHPFHHG